MTLIQNPQHSLNPKMKVIMVHYPLDVAVDQLFPPSQSNSAQYKAVSKSLVRKLHKKGLLSDFHDQMVKSIKEDHCIKLSKAEGEKMLKEENHCLSGINYCIKPGSNSHKLRLVTNSSSNHPNGSLNSHIPKGTNLLGSLKHTFTKFRMKMYAIMLDLARAYRSLYSTKQTNQLRLMWWVENPSKAMENLDEAMRIFMLTIVTYGDQGASTQLELAIRKIILPSCKTKLARAILARDRYVDDLLTSHDDKSTKGY